MNDKPAPLWLHAYSGRENGLMVVGDRRSLKALGQQLVAAADTEPSSSSSKENWPVEVLHPAVAGPYADVPDFALSFHLEGSTPASELLPLRRRNLPAPLLFAATICAVVGVITIVRWAVTHLQ
jgi:hypothetical protein